MAIARRLCVLLLALLLGAAGLAAGSATVLATPVLATPVLVASWHSYNFNTCSTQSCWTSQIAPVIASVPVIAGEIGENDCAGTYIDPLTSWLDSENTSYLAWTWDDWANGCATGPVLITDYNGDPTAYGAAYQAHLAALAGAG
jgi:endoglucanase